MKIQAIKDVLVGLGPKSKVVRAALNLHCRRNGFAIRFQDALILISRGSREMVLAERDFYLVPITLECFDQTFEDMEPQRKGSSDVLDFSGPASHRYRRHAITLSFPGTPEDDSIAGYTHWHRPMPGELIFDIGAHAGFTTCIFAKMVGADGRVIAFEPDTSTRAYLERNVRDQGLSNVTIVSKAIDAKTGTAFFNADGTMGAGLVDYSVYGSTGNRLAVETLSLEDACREYGMPQFVKMDIEGAEISVIESASEFLSQNPVNLAFDSYHRMRDGRFTWMLLEPMLSSVGYEVQSSAEFGQMFTWAKPGASKA